MLSGHLLRVARTLRGVTQAQLAAASGVSVSAVAAFERGERELRTDTARRLARALGVSVSYFVDEQRLDDPLAD